MPRRNFYLLWAAAVVSLVCYERAEAQRSTYGRMFHTFVNVMQEIDRNYVEEVDQRELFEGALSGIAGQLDEYSAYIPPRQYQALREDLGKSFGGIGIQVSLDRETKELTVMSPLVGTPAYEAGILAGDKILEIDGESTEGFTLQDAVARIRGEPGEPVRLKVLHANQTEPRDYVLLRAAIQVETVLGDHYNPDGTWNFLLSEEPRIGYVRITSFSEQTSGELQQALKDLLACDMQGLILDLRNNPGGLLQSAVQVCDLFVERGPIVSTRGRDGAALQSFEARQRGTYSGFPVVVLVNQYSASASEIVAACLQDHGRAVVVGERTWGKGSVQNLIALEGDSSALKLTIATYWRPSGENIHRLRKADEDDVWGVRPDEGFEVKLSPAEFEKMMNIRRELDVVRTNGSASSSAAENAEPPDGPLRADPQLQKALDHLREVLEEKG